MFVYIHLHTVKILDIRVIAISYVPLNTFFFFFFFLVLFFYIIYAVIDEDEDDN